MIRFVSKKGVETYESFEDVPYEVRDYTEDLSAQREKGYCVHRKELDNKPKYDGWAGPMWDGGSYRYESWEVYDMLSR